MDVTRAYMSGGVEHLTPGFLGLRAKADMSNDSILSFGKTEIKPFLYEYRPFIT